ncbi:peptidoglycan-binding domain-containing protein [Cellulomonas hominis]
MSRRLRVGLLWVAMATVTVTAGFMAGRATLAPPTARTEELPVATFSVIEATVGRSSTFRAELSWPTRTVAFAPAQGTVTSVDVGSDATVAAGDVLFHIDLRPVVLAQGDVPTFRELAEGASGADVAQLQEFLREAQFLTAPADGTFGSRTTAAVRQWQKSLGLAATGVVQDGDIVFTPQVPARVVLGEDVAVGRRLAQDTALVDVVLAGPQFSITVDGNSDTPAAGTTVVVSYGDSRWSGVVGPTIPSDADQSITMLALEGIDGAPLCGQECSSLSLRPETGSITAQVEIVPSTTGPIVPVSSLAQDPVGDYVVLTPTGERLPVTVVVTDGSRAVVDGLVAGQEILVFPDAAPTTTSGPR